MDRAPTPLRVAIVDLAKLEDRGVQSAAALQLQRAGVSGPGNRARDDLLAIWRAGLAIATDIAPFKERFAPRKALQWKPAANQAVRRCTRVVSMVHELHKVGYQRIRIFPQEAGSGAHWRCSITSAGNIEANGYMPIRWDDDLVARYTSASGARYFDWPDAETCSARQLAALFLERFPHIAQDGEGRDWLYAGWLTDFLGLMENGEEEGLFVFSADYPISPKSLEPWMPPPPRP
jgi:hypothetical protein